MKALKYKLSFIVGFAGIAIGLIAFSYNYTLVPKVFPFYEVIAGPAMFSLSFFSEELSFTSKMIIFVIGQFSAFALGSFLLQKACHYLTANNPIIK